MEQIMLPILGLIIVVLGVVNCSGNISTIHYYNRRKVKEEDVPQYGKAIGTGTIIIGLAVVASFFIVTYWNEAILPYVLIPPVAVGLCFVLYGQFKYNKGIF